MTLIIFLAEQDREESAKLETYILIDETPKYLDHEFYLQCKTIRDKLLSSILSSSKTNNLFIGKDFVEANNARKDKLTIFYSTVFNILIFNAKDINVGMF